MGASGGFPIDIILFGMIAAFLVLRLKGILGRRTGFERPAQTMPRRDVPATAREGAASAEPPVPRIVPDPASVLGQTLIQMKAIDRTFEPSAFLEGAEKAFQMIVQAFAAGDRTTLRPLLGDDTWHAFNDAITRRERDGHVQVTHVNGVHSSMIEGAELKGNLATITVRITSDQVNMTRTETGQIVTGTDAVTELHDVWTFERNLTSPSPIWHLIAARSA